MSPANSSLIEHCFHDRSVIELARKQWRAATVTWLEDEYGNALPLLDMPRRVGRYLVSPYEAGVILSDTLPAPIAPNRRLRPLVERLCREVEGDRNLLVEIRLPFEFLEVHGHAILEPFLQAHFTANLVHWERSVDLRLSAEDILQRTTKRVRYNVRRGIREAPEIHIYYRQVPPVDLLREFFEAATHTRRMSGQRLKHQQVWYVEDRARLIEEGKAALAVCTHETYRGYLLALASRRLGYYWDGAWAGEKSEFAAHYLQYRMMLFLRDLGVRRYSLGYVFPGLEQGEGKHAQIAFFKNGFGHELRPIYTMTLTRDRPGVRLARTAIRGPLGRVMTRLLKRVGP